MEIQDLTLTIKQDMSHLNRQIAELQQVEHETVKHSSHSLFFCFFFLSTCK